MSPIEALDRVLDEFDGTHVEPLQAYMTGHPDPPMAVIVDRALTDDTKNQQGATWLLKEYGAAGVVPGPAATARLLSGSVRLKHWEAQLHLCQLVRHLVIEDDVEAGLFGFLQRAAESDKPFVRAWAYDGLDALADQHPHRREQVDQLLEAGATDPKASVRARIRNLREA